MTALPRVYARPGIPEAPGRARLLLGPRPVTARPPVRRPNASHDLAVFGLVCLLCGWLLAWGIRTEDVLAEREARFEAEETAEILSAHSDWIACQVVAAHQVVRGVPGFEPLGEIANQMREQLTPEMLAWCKGASPSEPSAAVLHEGDAGT